MLSGVSFRILEETLSIPLLLFDFILDNNLFTSSGVVGNKKKEFFDGKLR